MSNTITNAVSFEIIRYANCWEDTDILLKGLSPKVNDKIISIASAGDNSFSLLLNNPEIVVAVDISSVQLYLVELKLAAINALSRVQNLEFLGFKPCNLRVHTYTNSIRSLLSAEAQQYWDQNKKAIEMGVIYSGKFENYFIGFSKKLLPLIHNKKTIQQLFAPKTEQEQQLFYKTKWENWRWKLLLKLFTSKYVMGKFGRDPEFLKHVKLSVSEYIYQKAENHLKSKACQNNPILYFNLNGNYGSFEPHYLKEENFETIKQNSHKLVLKKGFVEDVFADYGSFDCMNLSNIFEYMNVETFNSTAKKLVENTNIGGRLAYWNLMVPRKAANSFPNELQYQSSLSETLTTMDTGFFYNCFNIDIKL